MYTGCLTDGHVRSKEEEGVIQRGHTVLASSLCMYKDIQMGILSKGKFQEKLMGSW